MVEELINSFTLISLCKSFLEIFVYTTKDKDAYNQHK